MATTWQELYQSFKKGEIAPEVEIDFGGRKVLAAEFFGEAEKAFQTATQWHQRNAEREKGLIARETELEARERAVVARPPVSDSRDTLDDSDLPTELKEAARLDPYWKAQATVVAGLQKEIRRIEETHKATWEAANKQAWTNHHLATLTRLHEKDKAFNPETLLRYAVDRGIADLSVAYDLMTRPSAVEEARKAGYEEGVAEGKKSTVGAFVPAGLRRPTLSPLEGETPKDMYDLRAKVSQDPDVVRAFVQDLEGGSTE